MSHKNKITQKNLLINRLSAKNTYSEPQADKLFQSDPLYQLDIIDKLRQDARQANSDLLAKEGQISRYKSEIQQLRSNLSCKEMIDKIDSSRQNLERQHKLAFAELEKKLKLEFQKFKNQFLAKMPEKKEKINLQIPNDSSQKLPSNKTDIVVSSLRNQIKILTDSNKQLMGKFDELKSGSETTRLLESELADLRSKNKGFERQITERDNQNRSLQEQISTLRKKAANVEGETTVKKEVIKKLSAFIKRSWTILQSNASKDNRIANPAKSINEGAEIEQTKLRELERYQTSVLQFINEKITTFTKNETININEISKLNDQIDVLKDLKIKNEAELKQEQAKTLNLTNKVATLQKRLKQETNLRTNAQIVNAQQSTIISGLNKDIISYKNQIAALTQLAATRLTTITQLEKQKKQNLTIIQTQTDRIRDLQKQIKDLQTENKRIKADLTQKIAQLERAKTNISTLQGEKKLLSDNLNKTKNELTTANETIKTRNSRISTLEQSQARLKDDVKKLEGDLKDAKARLTKAESDIYSLNNNLTKEKEDHMKSKGVINNMNKMMVAQASQYFTGKTKLLENTRPEKSAELEKQINVVLGQWRSSFNAAKFFNGSEVIASESIDWMVETLRYYVKETPASTRLVYRFDPLNEKTNFHKYFDSVPNLLVLVHLSNGTKIGGFTSYPVTENAIQRPGKGFIFSLTDSKAYYMRNQPRIPVASYDTYYFILGNAELRLRSQEKKVFSNFGIANSTFDNDGDLRTKFMRINEMTNNQQPIETYQFYEVKFQ